MAKTALVIDNDNSTISQITEVLGGLGYTVSSATEAGAGVEKATSELPSIMLVNLATPGSNGLELCKTIHNTDTLQDVPIILLTLREGKFDPVYVKLYGIVAFLKKPFENDALTGLVNEHSIATDDEPAAETVDFGAIPDEADATMTFDAGDYAGAGDSFEAEGAGADYDATVITDAAEDLGSLQDSFSQPDYSDDDTGADDGSFAIEADSDAGFDAGGFDAGAESDEGFDAGGFDAGGFDAGGFDAGGFDAGAGSDEGGDDSWGADSEPSEDDGSFSMGGGLNDSDDESTSGGEDEGWGMGGNISMDDEGSTDDEGDNALGGGMTDAFAMDSSSDAGSGFDAGSDDDTSDSGFDSEGTMTFDTGAGADEGFDAGGFDAGGEADGGFDADSFDAGGGDGGFDTGGADDASEGGFDSDGTMTLDTYAEDDSFADGADSFGDDDFGDDSFGVEDDFDAAPTGDEAAEQAADDDFGGDDYDYTGLFEAEGEGADDSKKGKKDKKKKGFKKGKSSKKTLVALLLILLIAALGGGVYFAGDMLPFEIPFISKGKPKTVAKRPTKPRTSAPAPTEGETKEEPVAAAPKPEETPVPAEEAARPVVKPAAKKVAEPAPKKAPAKPAEPPTISAGLQKGMFYVQFGVFSKPDNADRLAGQLKKAGYDTIKHKSNDSKGRTLTYIFLDRTYKTRNSTQERAKEIRTKTGFATAVYKH